MFLLIAGQTSTRSDNEEEEEETSAEDATSDVSLKDPSNPSGDPVSGHVQPSDPNANDSVEGAPGVIEGSELAPLGDKNAASERESLGRADDEKTYELTYGHLHG